MLYPAELRARGVLRYQSCRKGSTCCSEAGMAPAVLADIGGRALVAEVGRGTVVKGEGSGDSAGTVIVQVADRVGQRIPGMIAVGVVPVMVPRFRQIGDKCCHQKHDS